MQTDPADRLAADVDREARRVRVLKDTRDVLGALGLRERMWEPIAEILPDAAVVAVLGEVRCVVPAISAVDADG
jgi:hypothetical protein